jgi:heme/copper-type cytochrome/quinol oxidase subunit 1
MTNTTPLQDEPLKLHEIAAASALVILACAGLALSFTALVTRQYLVDRFLQIDRKRETAMRRSKDHNL